MPLQRTNKALKAYVLVIPCHSSSPKSQKNPKGSTEDVLADGCAFGFREMRSE